MDQIINHDDQIQTYLEKANAKANLVATNLYELEMDIEDMQDDWDE